MKTITLILTFCLLNIFSFSQEFSVNEYYKLDTNGLLHGSYAMKCNDSLLAQGYFHQGNPAGKWIFHNIDGQKIIEGYYLNGMKNGTWNYYKNNQIICQIGYKLGVLHGEIKSYKTNGKLNKSYNYDNGTLLDNKKDVLDFTNFYFITDIMPLFLGQEIVKDNMTSSDDIKNESTNFDSYLKSELDKLSINSKGNIFVEFTVGLLGEVNQVKMIRGFSENENEQILNIFRSLPFFEPGYKDSFPVNVRFTKPINFD